MAIRILSVDDEQDLSLLLNQKFRKQIKSGEVEIFFSNSATEALEKIKKDDKIDIVLADINMPGMDGLTMLGEIQNTNRPFLHTIMVSAYSDMQNLRKAMNNGAFDFITKPIDFEDLDATIRKTQAHIEMLKKSAKMESRLHSLEEELQVAKRIQLSLLPRIFPPFPQRPEIELFASMNAAKMVGGDFYDFFFIDDHRLGIVIGDVSGKGIPAALFMAISKNIIRATAIKGLEPDVCLFESNNLICKESVDCMFITVFYGILNTLNGEFVFSNGGHNSPVLIKKSGALSFLETTNNAILGGMFDLPYSKLNVTLQKGDTIFCYTDGVTEAENEKKDLYTDERMLYALNRFKVLDLDDIHTQMENDIKDFVKDADQSDDITMLSLRWC